MKNRYEIPDSATKYILFQRTEYLALAKTRTFRAFQKLLPLLNYNQIVELEARLRSRKVKEMYLIDMEAEYSSIKKFLPDNCSRILDIGCGVAGIDLFLNQHYLNGRVDFYLLDKSRVEKNVYYMYQSKGAFYNSLRVAREILMNNGIDANQIHLLEAKENNSIDMDKSVDLVLSLISWGFHYPVSIYLDQVYDLLNETGTLILDIRRSTDGLDLLTQKFGEYRVILETRKHTRVCATK
jgi:SAM-dependent methyltransferase